MLKNLSQATRLTAEIRHITEEAFRSVACSSLSGSKHGFNFLLQKYCLNSATRFSRDVLTLEAIFVKEVLITDALRTAERNLSVLQMNVYRIDSMIHPRMKNKKITPHRGVN